MKKSLNTKRSTPSPNSLTVTNVDQMSANSQSWPIYGKLPATEPWTTPTESEERETPVSRSRHFSFTKLARPLFLYTSIFLMVWNYVVLPLLGRPPVEYPEALFVFLGTGVVGYTAARSWEKVSGTELF